MNSALLLTVTLIFVALLNSVMLTVNRLTLFRMQWLFAWYHFLGGPVLGPAKRILYFFPIPVIGIVLIWPQKGLKAHPAFNSFAAPKSIGITPNVLSNATF